MIHHTSTRLKLFATVLIGCCVIASAAARAIAATVSLTVTGSTLLIPLFKLWIPDYTASNPNVVISATARGSGIGIEAAISGKAHIGLSDIHFSDEQAAKNPEILNIPLAISAQTINYNLPGLNSSSLRLSGPVLAGVYAGTIRQWDDAAIQSINPGVTLPHHAIFPIRRSDSSGDTFLFTEFLDFCSTDWDNRVGYGTSVNWPSVEGDMTAVGNEGMVKTAAATPYSIAYIGISLADDVAQAHLGAAMVQNQNGKFLLPTPETIDAAASELDRRTPPDERLSLAFAPGDNSYPLINYEYALVSASQTDPAVAKALRDFLLWAGSRVGGNAPKYLDAVNFVPLPDFIRALNEKQIAKIK
ncbi:MAG: phosphate ABC transporter substrate-binding protein PstS [Candidatus Binataceae bacterium]